MIDRRRALTGVKKLDLHFNQLVMNGNFVSKSSWTNSRTSMTVSDNVAFLKRTGSGNPAISGTQIEGLSRIHKYYLTFESKAINEEYSAYLHFADTNGVLSGNDNDGLGNNATADFVRKSAIKSPANNRDWLVIKVGTITAPVGEAAAYFRNVMAIDLTAMYGAGNEPTDPAQVEADCAAIGKPLTRYQQYKGL